MYTYKLIHDRTLDDKIPENFLDSILGLDMRNPVTYLSLEYFSTPIWLNKTNERLLSSYMGYMRGSRKICQRVTNIDFFFSSLGEGGSKYKYTTINGPSSGRQQNAV